MKLVSKAKHVWMIYEADGSHVAILPGVNLNVEDKIMEHPDFKKRVEMGLIEVSGPASDFKQMGTKELLADIKLVFDIKTLEKILAEDERVAIQKAAQDQLAEIRKGAPRDKGSKK